MILPIDAALCLVRQLVPAVAILHETARDAAHGAIAPERLIVGPNNRLVVTEYVLGSALEQLLFSRERYWTDLRIALPRVAGLPRFDHLADVTQIGVVALQLILGRLLRDDEYPTRIADIVSNATAVSQSGPEPLAAGLKGWLNRALQLDPRHSFPSAIEARADLDRVIAESGYEASPESLDAFLAHTWAVTVTVVEPLPIRPIGAPEIVAPVVAAVAKPAPAPAPLPIALQSWGSRGGSRRRLDANTYADAGTVPSPRSLRFCLDAAGVRGRSADLRSTSRSRPRRAAREAVS
jgi:serine/threonine protein kinase